MIGTKLGQFLILEQIGAGGMGEVYRAEDADLDRHVALKVLPDHAAEDDDRLERFRREARVVAGLNHPNIVTIYTIGKDRGVHFFTMELVEGETLAAHIPAGGVETDKLLQLAIEIAAALEVAHAQGIVHRDLKPNNVIVTSDGHAKVLDFGLAKCIESEVSALGRASTDDEATLTLTRPGMLLGSISYMSPEQAQSQEVDHRSDLFSYGSLMYHLAVGGPPFAGTSPIETLHAIIHDNPVAVAESRPELPAEFGRLVADCLRKDPKARPSSAGEIASRLRAMRSDSAGARVEVQQGPLPNSIAVLPFADMSPERDQGYFCEGVAEEITSALSQLDGVKVVSRTSAFQFKGRARDIREVGRTLGVDAVLEGSVRKAGNRLRVMAQLVEVKTGYHLWSERFDKTLDDVFAIQDEIAECTARCLQGVVTPSDRERLHRDRPAQVDAYEYYLRGRKHLDHHRLANYNRAYDLFRKAIEIDPEYAPAYCGIADTRSWLCLWYGGGSELLDEAEQAAAKALELAPELAEAHVSRGMALSLAGEREAADAAFQRAVELNPSLWEAHYLWGRNCFSEGRPEAAVRHFADARAANPLDFQTRFMMVNALDALGREQESLELLAEGIKLAERHLELNPVEPRALYLGATALLRIGQRERAERWAQRAREAAPDEPPCLYNLACFYARAGQLETALECLEVATAEGFGQLEWIENDVDLEPLRGEPRFEQILDRLRA